MANADIEIMFREALKHHQAGRLERADGLYRQILALNPRHADSLHLLGMLAYRAGHPKAAVSLIEQAIVLQPEAPVFHNNLANILKDMDLPAEAIKHLRISVRLAPAYAEAHYNLGCCLQSLGTLPEAAISYLNALRLQPTMAPAHHNLGNVYKGLGNLDQALIHFHKSLSLHPGLTDAHYNMADAYYTLATDIAADERLKAAEDQLRQALHLKPDFIEAHNNLGVILQEQGRHDQALEHFRMATALKPDHAESHVNAAMILLLKGDLEKGWRAYEWRHQLMGPQRQDRGQPLSETDHLTGKSILLHAEQGLGDCIQFIRYASLLKQRGAKIFFLCPQPLVRLFRSAKDIDLIVPEGQPLPPHDYQASLMSLPGLMGTTFETIPKSVPYLFPDPADAALWKKNLPGGDDLKVGLVWAGNSRKNHPSARAVDLRRSLPLSLLLPLSRVPGARFYSLQKEGAAREQIKDAPPGLVVSDMMDKVEDFADTAALIAQLDLVIGVDTSVIHLAGAMGKPVWVLSRFDGCWRWLQDRDDSPWYPSLRLFRQTVMGDWLPVIENVRAALASAAVDRKQDL